MKLKSFLCAGILAIPALFPVNARATPTVIEQHEQLLRTINSLGIPIIINSKIHCNGNHSGKYFTKGFMVICQDNRSNDGKEVAWTDNDLDTLRHEAHHLIQDCADGKIGDGKATLYFPEKNELIEFLRLSGYTSEQFSEIRNHYSKIGHDDYAILLEFEAFAVARTVSAGLIAKKLKEYCS